MIGSLAERLKKAIDDTPEDRRGYVLRVASQRFAALSFSDLLTDLEPFIAAEVEARAAEEREACAALVDSWPLDSEPFGSREFGSRVFEAVDALAVRIRARST